MAVDAAHTDPQPIAHHILEEAAQWLTTMQEAPLTDAEQRRFSQWQSQSEAHQRAWRRAEHLLIQFRSLPTELASPSLRRSTDSGRRRTVQALVAMLLAVPVGWQLWRHQPWRALMAADYVALQGQTQQATLADGSQITLNTATEVDVYFAAQERLLHLRKGEIYISTAKDPQQPPRPFLVRSAQGRMRALGTRFSVRQLADATWLAVYEGAVQVQPSNASETSWRVVSAGEQVRFGKEAIGTPVPVTEGQIAWRNGLLMADNMTLSEWSQELARYSGTTFDVAPSAHKLRISGVFPTHDLPRALQMLTDAHGVTARLQGTRVAIGY